jgi:hypothetical protein
MSKRLLDLLLLNPMIYLLTNNLHVCTPTHPDSHTCLRNIQNHNNECVDISSDYLVHWLPNNTNQLYAHSTLHTADVMPEDPLACKPYYTLHRYKASNHYVCVDVLSDCFCNWKHYYTHHIYKSAQQYVCIDVLSDCTYDGMPYYTHHMYKGDHHCVCLDVLSDCSVDWTPYYTHHIYKGVHQYVCADDLSECSYY